MKEEKSILAQMFCLRNGVRTRREKGKRGLEEGIFHSFVRHGLARESKPIRMITQSQIHWFES